MSQLPDNARQSLAGVVRTNREKIAVLLWGGLFLRESRLRALIPLRRLLT